MKAGSRKLVTDLGAEHGLLIGILTKHRRATTPSVSRYGAWLAEAAT